MITAFKDNHHTFRNVQITLKFKNRITCNNFNLIYVVICDTCKKEYTGETGEGKTKLRDRVYPNTLGNHNTNN